MDDQVFAYASAAALHGLPLIGAWPDVVHTYRDRSSGGRSTSGIVRHCDSGAPRVVAVGECRVTDVARTVVDLARCEPFASHARPGAPGRPQRVGR
ncbi:hypothetical protein IF650_11295 [Cellulosimicrobium terreum]|nr:hypothetical protein [Cellulosimicrobium terreum]